MAKEIFELLEYSRFLRHRYLDVFGRLSWEEFVKPRGASFDSLRDIFLHCMFVMDLWINHLLQGDATRPEINFADFDSMDKVREYTGQVEAAAARYLSAVTPEELARPVKRKLTDGTVLDMTVEDVLLDWFQEECHHRGEFIALLYQTNVEPPHLGWGRYLNRSKFRTSS